MQHSLDITLDVYTKISHYSFTAGVSSIHIPKSQKLIERLIQNWLMFNNFGCTSKVRNRRLLKHHKVLVLDKLLKIDVDNENI